MKNILARITLFIGASANPGFLERLLSIRVLDNIEEDGWLWPVSLNGPGITSSPRHPHRILSKQGKHPYCRIEEGCMISRTLWFTADAMEFPLRGSSVLAVGRHRSARCNGRNVTVVPAMNDATLMRIARAPCTNCSLLMADGYKVDLLPMNLTAIGFESVGTGRLPLRLPYTRRMEGSMV